MTHASKLLSLILLAAAATTPSLARADDPDCDYVGRHYKTDLEPTGIAVRDTRRSGDIPGGQMITLDVANVGSQTFDYPAQPGELWHAVDVSLTIAGADFRGYLTVPFAGGARGTVLYSVPAGTVRDCTDVTVLIDAARAARQWGCNVYGNDQATYKTVHIAGEFPCTVQPIHHGGHLDVDEDEAQ